MNSKTFTKVEPRDIVAKATGLKAEGYRLSQMHAHKKDVFELTYTFVKGNDAESYRIELPEEEELVSISGVFWPAFLYENEMKDLYGVKITNIVLDYEGHLYKVSQPTPFNPKKQEGEVE